MKLLHRRTRQAGKEAMVRGEKQSTRDEIEPRTARWRAVGVVTPSFPSTLSSVLFIAGGSLVFVGIQMDLQALTWEHTALLAGGLVPLGAGMARSRREDSA